MEAFFWQYVVNIYLRLYFSQLLSGDLPLKLSVSFKHFIEMFTRYGHVPVKENSKHTCQLLLVLFSFFD